jgi:phosphinothricin acetyltransferase
MPIRLSKEQDLGRMTEIYNQAIKKGACTADTETFTSEQRRNWFESHQNEKYPLYVLESDNEVIGYCYFTPYRPGRKAMDKTAEISYYLDEQYHGMGYGSRMMEFVLKQAEKNGFNTLLAILLSVNKTSISLLIKFGFKEWGCLPDIANFDHFACNHLFYGKKL